MNWFMVIAGGFYISQQMGTTAAVFAILFYILLEAVDYRLDSEDVIILEKQGSEEVEVDDED